MNYPEILSYLFIGTAFFFANLPFITQDSNINYFLSWILRIEKNQKVQNLFRLIEFFFYYMMLGAISLIFDDKSIEYPCKKEPRFYLITFFLYLMLSYPGIVYRYLVKQKKI